MPVINAFCEGEGAWPDLKEIRDDGRLIDAMGPDVPPLGMALLPGGMVSGAASVALRVDLPDGRTVITETSFRVLENVVAVFKGYLMGKAERGGDA